MIEVDSGLVVAKAAESMPIDWLFGRGRKARVCHRVSGSPIRWTSESTVLWSESPRV